MSEKYDSLSEYASAAREYLKMKKVYRYRMKKIDEMNDSAVIHACHCWCEENGLVMEYRTFEDGYMNDETILIRKYRSADREETAALFYDTVHSVNAADYTAEQLDAWADGNIDIDRWDDSLCSHYSLVAVKGSTIVGFGDIDGGYLDRLYVHKDYQRQGIATAICDELEKASQGNIVTHASITAVPFFTGRGYKIVRRQSVERRGVFLVNYIMEKQRP